MADIMSLVSYRLDVEWVLTWFPIQARAATDVQKTRAGDFHFVNTDQPFASGNDKGVLIGHGPQQDPPTFGDPLTPDNVGFGAITVTTNQDGVFSLAFQVSLGPVKRTKSLLAPPNIHLPFMINAIARADNPETHGTGLSLYGTITTAKRPLDLISGAFQPGKIDTSLFRP